MVTTCKETFRDKKISDKCHTAMEKKDIIEMLPVTSERTNLTYINRFCLMCNEANLTDDDIVDFWDAKIVTYANYYYHRFVLNPNELIDSLKGYNVGNSNITLHRYPAMWCNNVRPMIYVSVMRLDYGKTMTKLLKLFVIMVKVCLYCIA